MCKAKDELEKIAIEDALIDSKLEELARLKSMATKVTSAMSGEAVSGSRSGDKLANAVARIIEMEAEIDRLVDSYVDRKKFLAGLVDRLPKAEWISVIYGHYYQGKSYEKLAEEMGYSRRNVCYLNGDAVAELDKMLREEKRFPEIS